MMEKLRFRCHFSYIFEGLWQFWTVIALIIIQQADSIVQIVRDIGTEGFTAIIHSGGLWILAAVILLSVAVFVFQFLRWRKTWITLEDNLIIIERNTLKKYKNTIAIENISAVNMERNLFERLAGTYKIKLDTGSMTTADETDVTLILKENKAKQFKKTVIDRMEELKNSAVKLKKPDGGRVITSDDPEAANAAFSMSKKPDERQTGRKIFRCTGKDMFMHAVYTLPLTSLLIAVCGIAAGIWYVSRNGFDALIENALGGFLAALLMVLSAIYNIIRRFVNYYDFAVYRDKGDIHISCGLIKLRNYTIPADKITAIKIEQPAISRIFGRYSAKVVTVGIGDEKGENSNITMSLPIEKLQIYLSELLPEYNWADIQEIKKEASGSVYVRLLKSVKWHILTVAAIISLSEMTEWPWWITVGAPVICDIFINILYLLSHITAGYKILDKGMVISEGYFTRTIDIFTYEKMQILFMNYHPAARRLGIGRGTIRQLASVVTVPYIKKEEAFEISKRIIQGGAK